ncbi:glutamate-1-semialdehyde 2,1-aminomutase [Lautropia dentalis]|uniref:Glutamate-1-semialdehyde 2,1-aminomutase n=1 Tax=Lautropia dentalis TaxID=2490857 RepID=A0A3R8LPT4_9BURK|nr:glutamate-1-semialdehyde 2,1-aminomutase [Lautropia dentalis]RRN44037.1 glutamate-1-semialdehyde 2,1-aminomutase [Lautropia dentalis]
MSSSAKPAAPAMVERTCFDKSKALRPKVHSVIPGGAHTYAKGDDQYPELSPGFIERGKGCHIWDVDGNEFIEYGMGLRAVTLGHAYPSIIEAAHRQMLLGNNFNRPATIELQAAEMLQSLIPSAEMVKFAKDGSTILTAALKLARAHTGRKLVAICSNSPFFSYNDWFIGTTAMDGGVNRAEVDLTVKFNYNDIDSLKQLFAQYPDQIAMVLLEPARTEEPKEGFLQQVIDLSHQHGALVTLDETISGFRFHKGGAQTLYGVTPDMSCFGKAMANGFSLSALTGKREVMELGGLFHNRERVFLLSTTHGAEGPSLAAGIETMRIYRDEPVIEHLYRVGDRLRAGFQQVTADLGVSEYLGIAGRGCNLLYSTHDHEHKPSQPFRTLFMQELIRWGVLAPSFIVSYAHSDADIDHTIEAVARAAKVYKKALEAGSTDGLLVGAPTKVVYRRYN